MAWAALLGLVFAVQARAQSADLALEVLSAPEVIAPGAHLPYAFRLTNRGPDAAQTAGIAVSVSWPGFPGAPFPVAGVVSISGPPGWGCGLAGPPPVFVWCNAPTMPVGSAEFVVTVVASTVPHGAFELVAGASSSTSDPVATNNSVRRFGTLFASVPLDSPAWLAMLALVLAAVGASILERRS